MAQKPERPFSCVEVGSEVPRLLHHTGSLGVGGATGEMDAPCRELDEHQNVESISSIPIPTQSAMSTLEWIARKENLCVCGLSVPARATS
jgi:hypothetical protein